MRLISTRPEKHKGNFWIDAICINQDDNTEKTSEVLKMADIYRSAASVLVWLGECDVYSVQAIELISILAHLPLDKLNELDPHNMSKVDVVAAKLGDSFTPEHWTSLGHFLKRSWFTRVWIIQEIVLANKIEMLCGPQELVWEHLVLVSNFVKLSEWRPYFNTIIPDENDRVFAGSSPSVLRDLKEERTNDKDNLNWRPDIILSDARGYRAMERNDHVYALLSLMQEHFTYPQTEKPHLITDYNRDPNETYALVARLLLEHAQDLLLLSMVEDGSLRTTHGIPSWAPDWSVCYHGIGLIYRIYFSSAAGMSQKPRFSEPSDILLLRGASLDVVVEVGPPRSEAADTWENFRKWLEIIRKLDPVYLPNQSRIEAFWRTLVLDADGPNEVHPAPSSMEVSFRSWIQFTAIGLITLATSLGENRAKELAYLDELFADAEITFQSQEMNEHISAFESKQFERLADWIRAMASYDTSFAHSEPLALFRTAKGFLGYGPVSTQPGDEVWILPGATVPFVLRKTSKCRYCIVGDTYVHGVMQGEALDGNGIEFSEIEIE